MIPSTFFPKMPCEVRTMWLDSIAVGHGWEFETVYDSVDNSPWRYVFGDMTLIELSECDWNLQEIDLTSKPFSQISFATVEGLYKEHFLGISTIYANIERTNDRFWACANFIREHGDLPAPIVVRDRGDRFDLLDGNHRMAALLSIGRPKIYNLKAWVASLPK